MTSRADLILPAGMAYEDVATVSRKKADKMKYKMTHTNSDEYSQMRAYMIPDGLVRFDGKNVLAVRVYDCWQGGGI